MAFDIVHRVGIDDSAVGQGFRRVEAAAKSSGQRVGEALERKTAGARKLAGALGSTVGIYTQIIGAVGVVTGAMAGVVALAQKWTAEEAKRKRLMSEQRTIVDGLRESMAGSRMGFAASSGSRSGALDQELAAIRAEANEAFEQNREAASKGRKALRSEIRRRERNFIPTDKAQARLDKLDRETDDRNTEILALRRRREESARRRSRFGAMFAARGADAELAGSRGDDETRALLQESIESDKRLFELREAMRATDDDQERGSIQHAIEMENERHANEVENIREAHRLKREAAAEDARRAREAREREEKNARFLVRQQSATLEAQRLRLEGHEREARLMEIQVRHNERLRRIGEMGGVGALERMGLVGQAIALFGAERAALDGGGDARGGSLTGFRGASAIQARQALGRSRRQVDPEGAHRERDAALQTGQFNTQREINRKMDSLRIIGDALIDMRSLLQEQARQLGLS